ncbi:ribonuclease P protein component [Pigmentiphaga aceris]|uniref:Ribonuclease P protein component n=1 Tax=Pigmentiphaga aceris TaxID=1940612 RepID=A0A5C0B858_9BURK|nr:ribonuclease P protein component [Pigmentiphaga aceris]QEI09027.1 ribonuclease P protein component [Pigmentiphaga aceris]
MLTASFPKTARLRSPAEFAPALKGRRLAKGALFVLSASSLHAPVATAAVTSDAGDNAVNMPADATPAAPIPTGARLGLVIGKRNAPLSVSRNTLRRVLREAFRHVRLQLPPRDYVVRLHSRIAQGSLTSLKQLARAEADAHFARAIRQRDDSARPARPRT